MINKTLHGIRKIFAIGSIVVCFAVLVYAQGDSKEGETIFSSKCTACHTIGGGKLIGPDLSGVTEKREEAWLKRQIKEPDKLLAEGDPIANGLLKEFGVPMAPLGLNDAEVENVIAFLKGSGEGGETQVQTSSYFLPTLLISFLIIILFTIIGLKSGRKNSSVTI
ncbi:MAG: cytochrome c [Ignavibacteriaceae bacterium]|jgi:Cytochrome c2|nr:MAG: Cytochrome c6 [Chlorobi bacterium OLB4]MBW7855213.1 cytochrome c [Ignavibacteria bacterium]MEB2330254.1 cytochrome c [Ignavibacteriaceae bacterium]OQY77867.1 MAG: hypothetical protein B6D43_04975 [Ignavibacteriales bacterium UTCHB1]